MIIITIKCFVFILTFIVTDIFLFRLSGCIKVWREIEKIDCQEKNGEKDCAKILVAAVF